MIFLPSPAFLYFRKMVTQSIGVSWGKLCQPKSLSHGNLGAAALESSRQGLVCFGKGNAGYCMSSACSAVALFLQDWGNLIDLSLILVGNVAHWGLWQLCWISLCLKTCSSCYYQQLLIWTRPWLLSISVGQRVVLSWESQSTQLRGEECRKQKPCAQACYVCTIISS